MTKFLNSDGFRKSAVDVLVIINSINKAKLAYSRYNIDNNQL